MFQTLIQDARYAARMLRATPVFTAIAALSLAIGIGANATIFAVASAMLLRPLPGLADPDRLVDIGWTQNGSGFNTASYPNYLDFRSRTTLLEDVYAVRPEPQPMSLAGANGAERVYGTVVTANYFTVLGTRAHLGRLLRAEDDEVEGGSAVVVLSFDLWEQRYAAGVAPANAEASAIAAALEREFPDDNRGKGLTIARSAVVPGGAGMVARFLAVLLAIVALVLLTACVNVAGMLLAASCRMPARDCGSGGDWCRTVARN